MFEILFNTVFSHIILRIENYNWQTYFYPIFTKRTVVGQNYSYHLIVCGKRIFNSINDCQTERSQAD